MQKIYKINDTTATSPVVKCNVSSRAIKQLQENLNKLNAQIFVIK